MSETALTDRQRQVLALHLDPNGGSRYWLERAGQCNVDNASELVTTVDLLRFGPMDEQALSTRPYEDFVPASCLQQRQQLITAETGGSLGKPKLTVYRQDEFEAAFVTPFVKAAEAKGFPSGGGWLWIGPGGPHIIGKAARACATAMGAADPFTVDFDARWAKKMAPGSLGARRYLDHVVDQAMDVLQAQHVSILFSTPPVFEALAQKMTEEQRNGITGLHFGGIALSADLVARLRELYPHAVFLAGYGNTLCGMSPEFGNDYDQIEYFPLGDRLLFRTIAMTSDRQADASIHQTPATGEPGIICFSRLDESFMILNMIERDQGTLVEPDDALKELGFTRPGLRNPGPRPDPERKVKHGLY